MSAPLVLVKHAMPELVPGAPPAAWELGEEGREAARQLAVALPPDPLLVASTEPKARQTAEAIAEVRGGDLLTHAGLIEVVRPDDWVPNHRELAHAYVRGTRHAAWEAQADVAARFDAAVRAAVSHAGGRPLVVVSHGMAMTTWLSTVARLGDAGDFWRALTFPDAWSLSRAALDGEPAAPVRVTGCQARR